MENDAGHVSELSHDPHKMHMRACTCMSDTESFLKHLQHNFHCVVSRRSHRPLFRKKITHPSLVKELELESVVSELLSTTLGSLAPAVSVTLRECDVALWECDVEPAAAALLA